MSTDLENFKLTVNHQRPKRTLFYANFTADIKERIIEHIGTEDIHGHYGMYKPAMLMMQAPEGTPKLDYSRYWEDEDLPEGTTINHAGVAVVPSGFYHFFGYVSPLRNATDISEIAEYPMHERTDWDTSYMKPFVDEAHANGQVVIGAVGHIYETAWQIRGYEQFLMDMIERPEWAQLMIDRIAANAKICAFAYAEAGADMVLCGDDIANQNAMMFQPDMWREMLLSRWREIWQGVKKINPDCRTFYHTDGNVISVVQDLIDAGLDILNPLQPECLDVDEVHRRWGDELVFEGCMGTQSTMPFGSPDDVKARVKEIIDKYGQNGGLIIAPTHVLEPDVPIANVDAYCEACREYGTFE